MYVLSTTCNMFAPALFPSNIYFSPTSMVNYMLNATDHLRRTKLGDRINVTVHLISRRDQMFAKHPREINLLALLQFCP